jgi:hypothetical protein
VPIANHCIVGYICPKTTYISWFTCTN